MQDISLRAPAELTYQKLADFLLVELEKDKPADTVITVKPVDIYRADDGVRHLTFRIWISAFNRTLQADEINTLLDTVAAKAKDQLQAERI